MRVKLFVITMELSHGSSAVVASCCGGACFPLGPPPSPPSSHHAAPPSPIHVLWLIWMGMSKATSNTCSTPSCPPPFHPTSTATTTLSLPSHYLACFPLSSPYCSVLCDLLKPGRHVITLLDTKNSRQAVFLVEEEEKEEGKQSDTTNLLSGHSVQPERTFRFCQKTLISFSRKNASNKRIKCSIWFSLTRKVDTVDNAPQSFVYIFYGFNSLVSSIKNTVNKVIKHWITKIKPTFGATSVGLRSLIWQFQPRLGRCSGVTVRQSHQDWAMCRTITLIFSIFCTDIGSLQWLNPAYIWWSSAIQEVWEEKWKFLLIERDRAKSWWFITLMVARWCFCRFL